MEKADRRVNSRNWIWSDPERPKGFTSERVRPAPAHRTDVEMRQVKRVRYELDFPVVIVKQEHNRGPRVAD